MRRRARTVGGTLLLAMGLVAATTLAPAPAGAEPGGLGPAVRLAAQAPLLPAGASVIGPSDGSDRLTVDVSLAPREPAALDAFVAAVSTPGSSRFHQYLAAGQFASRFGPAAATIDSVRAWLASTGLQVGSTTPDGLLIPVTGTTAQMEQAWSVPVVDARLSDGRVARFGEASPAVPSALAPSIQGVIGLSTVAQPSAQILPGPAVDEPAAGGPAAGATASPNVTPASRAVASPCPQAAQLQSFGAYTADQLAATYGFTDLYDQGRTGAGQRVGIYELEPFTAADIATYESCYGISVPVSTVSVDGGATGAQSGEAALDIEDVAGLAPSASITVYSGPQAGSGPIDTYARMVDDDSASVLVTSWGLCEARMGQDPGEQAAETSLFAQAAAQGQTVVAASGDAGSTDCYDPGSTDPDLDTGLAVDDPADQPDVTGVGGTSLLAAGATPTETVWNASGGSGGGGVSADFPAPWWQVGPGVGAPLAQAQCTALGRSSCREVPDVSASADPAHGYAVYVGGRWQVFGGTSGGSPLWGALIALVDQGRSSPVGLVDPILYASGSCAGSSFNDIVTGGNAFIGASNGRYPAAPDYDVASGWGSPVAARFLAAVDAPPACPVISGLSQRSGPAAGGNPVTITGSNFSGATSVRFGAAPAAFRVVSSTSIVAVAPAGPAGGGSVDVTVANADGASVAVSADRYSFVLPGYWLVASDGGIFAYGDAQFYGSAGSLTLNKPIVGMAATPDGGGYWLVASDGGIFAYGDAQFYGSAGSLTLNKPIVGMAATPDGGGYWLVASDGGIFAYGDAQFYGSAGSLTLNKPIVGMAATPDGGGYWLVASDGGIFAYGDAQFYGSAGSLTLNKPIVGMAATPDGGGYWLVASDGGIFAYGDAQFYGSAGSLTLNKPIVGMAATPDGGGYWLVASDGGIFAYGDAQFYGSAGSLTLNKPIVGMAPT